MDDFLQWMISPEGQMSEQVLFDVLDHLEVASVDPHQRKIIWSDGARLSIRNSAQRIQQSAGLPFDQIESQVIGWLEIHYEPPGLDEQQMEEFERLIDEWILSCSESL